MRIQLLGTGDAFCSGGRYQTCFMVEVPEYKFLIDCGATSLLAMKTREIPSHQIDGMIISHFHGDHYGGIPYFLLDANFTHSRDRPLTILGPPGVQSRVEALVEIAYSGIKLEDLCYPISFIEFKDNQRLSMGPLEIEGIPVIHVAESKPHGIRIQYEHKILSFTGDTGWTENIYKLADGADLFICECNFFERELPSHLSYKRIQQEYPRLKCKRILLNHLGTEMLEHLAECSLECSQDGMVVEI